ncbi:NAD-dependent epimerase/dehydratase family protein [Crocinitomix algicola]|uniref:NAD-dependent epimerase/dehydratase family protein n=1 Tax=Crocinitomix algicola TaxID=1740263 RepID=UPI00082F4B50|nr:NAD-dependent epimerase/dehydratase family protein [Crocinitomix algicola]
MSKKSLVTGGAGFIGSHIAKELIQLKHKVVILDDLSGGFKHNIPNGCVFIEGSILDFELIEKLFETYKFDYVYHMAAYAAEGLSHFIRRFNYQNNLIGSVNLINAAVNHNIKCFVFASSIAVYGKNDLPHHEGQIPQPEDPYGMAKFAVEKDLEMAHNHFGLNSIIFRPHNVYGPGQNIGDKYRNVIGIFMNQIMKNQALTIFGDGEQTRAFTPISSIAPYIAKSVNCSAAYNEIFDIGADDVYSVNQLALAVMEVMGKEVSINHVPARNEMKHAYANHDKFKQFFKPISSQPLKEALQEMAQHAYLFGAQITKDFTAIEIEKKLPSAWKKNL